MSTFNPLAHIAVEAAPQPTVAEAYALEMVAVESAMSSLFTDTAALTPTEPAYEEPEASEQNQDSQQNDQRANPQAIGTSTVKRKNRTTQGR